MQHGSCNESGNLSCCTAVRPTLTILLLAIAACATPPPPPAPVEPLPASPLARAALDEWNAWGRIVVEGWPTMRPADTAATPERYSRLIGYWLAVPGGSGIVRKLDSQRAIFSALLTDQAYTPAPAEAAAPASGDDDAEANPVRTVATAAPAGPEDIGLYNRPAWSAAFISAVARRAGMPYYDLPSAPAHARYIDALLARAIADPEGAAFAPHAPEEFAPRPGDLLCADRSWSPLPHWTARLAERGRPRAMHCDVVVRTAPGVIEAIGGNVEDLVVLRRLPADSDGRILPAPPGKPSFVLILATREPG
jgi:hypothetical protein